uniref:Uncharacterized protein n=1 Tax=Glossina palpalis gambiensis TaxID=67801 RepID=A0A1B0BYB2_9MUSC
MKTFREDITTWITHYAILRAAKNLGEQFLFPSRAQTRGCPRLDVQINDEGNLLLDGCQYKWHNCSLNSMQKKAPGTGKIATLVESILQLFKLIPSARLHIDTPSNSFADVITTRLIESGVLKMGDFIRMHCGLASENPNGEVEEISGGYTQNTRFAKMCLFALGNVYHS